MRLFDRELQLIAGGKDVSGLRVAFRVAKSVGPKLNSAEIKVWNMAADTAAATKQKGAKILLSAGYRGEMRLLFVGDVDLVTTEIEGPERVTTMKAGDGLNAARTARQFEALASAVNPGQVLERLGRNAGIAVKDAIARLRTEGVGAAASTFANGIVMAGPIREQFQKFAESLGYDAAAIRDEALLFYREGKHDGQQEVSLTPRSGLIGSPTWAKEQTPLGAMRDILKVRSLLNGELQPARLLHVESEQVDGWFIIQSVTHTGDTHGTDWYSDVEAIPA